MVHAKGCDLGGADRIGQSVRPGIVGAAGPAQGRCRETLSAPRILTRASDRSLFKERATGGAQAPFSGRLNRQGGV